MFLIVADSLGVGAMPDAPEFGDDGAHTLDHICEAAGQPLAPQLLSWGLGNIEGVHCFPAAVVPEAALGRMAEASPGKDTITGHWEMAGVPLEAPFPVFPDGFSDELLGEIMARTGVPGFLGNEAASGTEIIERLGPEHIETGKPILYTSADSVLQLAAHETHFGLERLYEVCDVARELTFGMGLGRVIARPFVDAEPGGPERFQRTYNRVDFSYPTPRDTILKALRDDGVPTVAVGKIDDIFDGVGITEAQHTHGNRDGMLATHDLLDELGGGLGFVNLVDFDMLFGHRRDPAGYRGAIEEFDHMLGEMLPDRRDDDLFIVTADHGNDPTFEGHTDHTREYVPLLVFGDKVRSGAALGTRATFADIAATLAHNFRVSYPDVGRSFLKDILVDELGG